MLMFVNCRPFLFLLVCLLFSITLIAQRKYATVSGKVLDENENPLPGVSVVLLGQQSGVNTSDSGLFQLRVPAERAIAIIFSFTGYKSVQQNFLLTEGEQETVTIRMETGGNTLQEVV